MSSLSIQPEPGSVDPTADDVNVQASTAEPSPTPAASAPAPLTGTTNDSSAPTQLFLGPQKFAKEVINVNRAESGTSAQRFDGPHEFFGHVTSTTEVISRVQNENALNQRNTATDASGPAIPNSAPPPAVQEFIGGSIFHAKVTNTNISGGGTAQAFRGTHRFEDVVINNNTRVTSGAVNSDGMFTLLNNPPPYSTKSS